MYESYWQLSEPPFDNSPNPKFFYLSPEHEEALVRLVPPDMHVVLASRRPVPFAIDRLRGQGIGQA